MQKIQRWFFFNDNNPEHIRALDGLRGIAVVLVLLSHASNNAIYFFDGLAFNGIGKGGVYLFFILSAFLLDRQIAAAMVRHEADGYFWKRYFLRRFLRIYPLFAIALLFFLGMTYAGVPTCIVAPADVLRHLFLFDGLSVFWSIPVEFKYYFISPLILLVCGYVFKWELKASVFFLLVLGLGFVGIDTWLDLDKISLFKYLIVFITGTIVALIHLFKQSAMKSFTHSWAICGFLALGLMLILNPNYVGDWMGISVSNNGRKIMLIYVALCSVMIIAALHEQNIFKRFLEIRVLRIIGVISYSVYLFHMPVIYVIREGVVRIPYHLQIYVFLVATFSLAFCTYFLVERPLARIKIPKPTPPTTHTLP